MLCLQIYAKVKEESKHSVESAMDYNGMQQQAGVPQGGMPGQNGGYQEHYQGMEAPSPQAYSPEQNGGEGGRKGEDGRGEITKVGLYEKEINKCLGLNYKTTQYVVLGLFSSRDLNICTYPPHPGPIQPKVS
jgi:hypothetical protein